MNPYLILYYVYIDANKYLPTKLVQHQISRQLNNQVDPDDKHPTIYLI